MSIKTVSLLSDIESFLNEKPYSQCTRESYRYHLTKLITECGDIENLTVEQFRSWLFSHEWWSDNHRWVAYCSIRVFLRWRFGSNHPALALRIRRGETAPQRTLNYSEVIRLIESFDTATPKGKRDLAICCLLLDTGLRSAEICRVDLRHVNLEMQRLSVIVKGGSWKEAVFSEQTKAAIERWLVERSHIVEPNFRYLFCGIGGNTPGKKLTPSGLRCIMRGWAKQAGIPVLSPHDFRRTFATLSIRNGAPSRIVQIAGRWSSLEMVERYTRRLELDDMRPYFVVPRALSRKTD